MGPTSADLTKQRWERLKSKNCISAYTDVFFLPLVSKQVYHYLLRSDIACTVSGHLDLLAQNAWEDAYVTMKYSMNSLRELHIPVFWHRRACAPETPWEDCPSARYVQVSPE